MGYEKILVPLDGSELSEAALHHIPLVAAPGAKIQLVSVVSTQVAEALSLTPELWDGPFDSLEESRGYLQKVAEPLIQQGYSVNVEAIFGPVVQSIADVSKRGFDVIIVATHHRRALDRFILGSVAERLLHETRCPILIV